MGESVVAGNFFKGKEAERRGMIGERQLLFPFLPLTSPSFPFVVSFRSSSRVERVAVIIAASTGNRRWKNRVNSGNPKSQQVGTWQS